MVLFYVFLYLSCLKLIKDLFFGGLKLKVYNYVKIIKVEDFFFFCKKEFFLDMMKFEFL